MGNKCDLADEKVVNTETIQEYAEKKKMDFYECSAKSSEYVEIGF